MATMSAIQSLRDGSRLVRSGRSADGNAKPQLEQTSATSGIFAPQREQVL
jgi:hypothetical protein